MKRAIAFAPPRSATIFFHTRRLLDSTSMCMAKFSARVVEIYVERLAPDQRRIPFKQGVTGEDLFRAERHNAQQLSRYMDGTVKALPADLEDAWVLALPEPYRSDCERDLGRRRGTLPFWVASGPSPTGGGVGAMAVEFGELVQALAPALADGRISPEDRAYARRILDEADGLIASVLGVRAVIEDLLGQGSGQAGTSTTKG